MHGVLDTVISHMETGSHLEIVDVKDLSDLPHPACLEGRAEGEHVSRGETGESGSVKGMLPMRSGACVNIVAELSVNVSADAFVHGG